MRNEPSKKIIYILAALLIIFPIGFFVRNEYIYKMLAEVGALINRWQDYTFLYLELLSIATFVSIVRGSRKSYTIALCFLIGQFYVLGSWYVEIMENSPHIRPATIAYFLLSEQAREVFTDYVVLYIHAVVAACVAGLLLRKLALSKSEKAL